MRSIKQTVEFDASPHEVFEALMDSKKHSRFTGAAAKISREVGGKFNVYDGGIKGTNIELIPDKKIVQDWYCQTLGWPEGHYSRATFLLKKKGKGTVLEFSQSGVPDDAFDDISQGWVDYYWNPMKGMFAKERRK